MHPVSTRKVSFVQVAFHHRAASVKERQPVALELLKDEPFTAKKAGPKPFVERNRHACPFGGTEKGVLLAQQRASSLFQIHRHDFARVRG